MAPRLSSSFPIALWLFAGILCAAGCGETVDPRGQRMAVRGAVSLDGQPLSRAIIVFSALNGSGKVTSTASIVDGSYEIPDERGPLVGMKRVEIRPEMMDLEEFEAARGENTTKRVDPRVVTIPVRYNSNSELTANVTDNPEKNTFDFQLKSR